MSLGSIDVGDNIIIPPGTGDVDLSPIGDMTNGGGVLIFVLLDLMLLLGTTKGCRFNFFEFAILIFFVIGILIGIAEDLRFFCS